MNNAAQPTTKTVDGITYNVLKVTPINQFPGRVELKLMRPKGRRCYFMVVYENGAESSVI